MLLPPRPRPLPVETAVAAGDLWARLQYPTLDAGDVYWLEFDPARGSSSVFRLHDGEVDRVTPAHVDVQSRVHEYGGGAYAVRGGTIVYSDAADGRIYRVGHGALTPLAPDVRYGDLTLVAGGVLCVREQHGEDGVVNDLVLVDLEGGGVEVVDGGRDFYSFPCADPVTGRLAWTAWDHPGMPFVGCELRCEGELIAGGPAESVFQPAWGPDGRLHYVSDRSGWWNLHVAPTGEPLGPIEGEIGWPQWFLGLSSYAFLADGRVAALVNRQGRQRLMYLADGTWTDAGLPHEHVAWPYLRGDGRKLVFVAAETSRAPELVLLDTATGEHGPLRSACVDGLSGRKRAHVEPLRVVAMGVNLGGLLHTPQRRSDRPPPLVVMAHGGPTDQTVGGLRVDVELLTSRGIAVADVDYSGSTGYGRAFRDRLAGAWGQVDVDDCVEVARALAAAGHADPRRLAILGGSAGGYIALAALARSEVFCAAVSMYGISDLGRWRSGTHKFEASYTDWLAGTDDDRELAARSPAAARRFTGAMLLLQGEDDQVVTPDHARLMAEAARTAGARAELVVLPGEGHGFRRPENVRVALEAILAFLEQAFGRIP